MIDNFKIIGSVSRDKICILYNRKIDVMTTIISDANLIQRIQFNSDDEQMKLCRCK